MPWEIFLTDEVNGWLDDLATVDDGSYRQVVYAIEALAEVGPEPRSAVGRPDQGLGHPQSQRTPPRIRRLHRGADLVRLRSMAQRGPAGRWRKASNWSGWYRHAIPHAEQLYETYLKQRAAEQEPPP
jgi:hypothetical protein